LFFVFFGLAEGLEAIKLLFVEDLFGPNHEFIEVFFFFVYFLTCFAL